MNTTGRTKLINDTLHHEYIDTDIHGRTSLQWISDDVLKLTDTELSGIYNDMVAQENALAAAADAADAQRDADGERIIAELIAMRNAGEATLANVIAALGTYATSPSDKAPFGLEEIVLAVQEQFGVDRAMSKLVA